MPPTTAVARVFFALWPDDEVRGALAHLATGLRRECGGRAVPARNLHLTLVFLGNIGIPRLSQLRQLAARVAAPPIAMTVDTVQYWRHNRIVWAGPRECPAALSSLVASLESMLSGGGFRFDDRPFAPHITLLRHARTTPAVPEAGGMEWMAGEFALVQSVRREGGPCYEVMDRWPLKGLN